MYPSQGPDTVRCCSINVHQSPMRTHDAQIHRKSIHTSTSRAWLEMMHTTHGRRSTQALAKPTSPFNLPNQSGSTESGGWRLFPSSNGRLPCTATCHVQTFPHRLPLVITPPSFRSWL